MAFNRPKPSLAAARPAIVLVEAATPCTTEANEIHRPAKTTVWPVPHTAGIYLDRLDAPQLVGLAMRRDAR